MSEPLEYSTLPDEIRRRSMWRRVWCIIVIAFGILTFADCVYIEFLNIHAGSRLPFPAAVSAQDHWRVGPANETFFRFAVVRRSGDPDWETRPLTPAERIDRDRFISQKMAESELRDIVCDTCVLVPLVPALLIGALILAFHERSIKWRVALTTIAVIQMGCIAVFVHLQLLAAIGKAID